MGPAREDLSDAERARWEPLRARLFASREGRVRPLKDDKVLTDWNGLMISAFARAGRAFGDAALVAQARRTKSGTTKQPGQQLSSRWRCA